MKKIISLFKRDYDGTHLVYDDVVPGAEWVVSGEGVATRKWDGTACAMINGNLYKRYDAKKGKKVPDGAIPCQECDPITGHHPHWVKISSAPEDKWFSSVDIDGLPDGTYEFIGEKINGNPEKQKGHKLVPHGNEVLDAPCQYNELKEWFRNKNIEGIVWHHPDGRMVKIKKKDFGLKRIL